MPVDEQWGPARHTQSRTLDRMPVSGARWSYSALESSPAAYSGQASLIFFNLDLERPWKKEYRQKMNASPDMPETPPELADAWARIDQAKENYISLAREMNEFLYKYVKGMVKGRDRESGNFVLQLRHPKESNVKGSRGS